MAWRNHEIWVGDVQDPFKCNLKRNAGKTSVHNEILETAVNVFSNGFALLKITVARMKSIKRSLIYGWKVAAYHLNFSHTANVAKSNSTSQTRQAFLHATAIIVIVEKKNRESDRKVQAYIE